MTKTKKRNVVSKLFALLLMLCSTFLNAQNIADFTSINPGDQTEIFRVPTSSHQFQIIARENDQSLSNGGPLYPDEFDYTAFVPHRNDYDDITYKGHLSLNHEIRSNGAVTVADIEFDPCIKKWVLSNQAPIDFSAVSGVQKPCSGAVTDWGTVLVCEEIEVVSISE